MRTAGRRSRRPGELPKEELSFIPCDSMLQQALAIDRALFGEPHQAVALDLGQLSNRRFLLRAAQARLDRDRKSQPRLAGQADTAVLILERAAPR